MNMMKPNLQLSKKGMKELKKSISRLERDQKAAQATLRELDKSTTREGRMIYSGKIAHLEIIESELSEKRLLLASSKPLPSKRNSLKVALGSIVNLIDPSGRVVRYQIVDSVEADPSDGRISAESPLGKTLLGRKVKEKIKWNRGLKSKNLQLISIK